MLKHNLLNVYCICVSNIVTYRCVLCLAWFIKNIIAIQQIPANIYVPPAIINAYFNVPIFVFSNPTKGTPISVPIPLQNNIKQLLSLIVLNPCKSINTNDLNAFTPFKKLTRVIIKTITCSFTVDVFNFLVFCVVEVKCKSTIDLEKLTEVRTVVSQNSHNSIHARVCHLSRKVPSTWCVCP